MVRTGFGPGLGSASGRAFFGARQWGLMDRCLYNGFRFLKKAPSEGSSRHPEHVCHFAKRMPLAEEDCSRTKIHVDPGTSTVFSGLLSPLDTGDDTLPDQSSFKFCKSAEQMKQKTP